MFSGLLVSLSWALQARAQEFPPSDEAWAALPCRANPIEDPIGDVPGADDERDLVGTESASAGYRGLDAQYAYFRMRLEEDPLPDGEPHESRWGFEIDLDLDRRDYEALILVDGEDEEVRLYRNRHDRRDDPTDLPDEPAVLSLPFEGRVRSTATTDSLWGNDPDFFLDVAVSWEELAEVGLLPYMPLTVWLFTSSPDPSPPDRLFDGDFACHDGSSGVPLTLSGGRPGRDLDRDTDGDGFSDGLELDEGSDPDDPRSYPDDIEPDSLLLEGGGGCSVAGPLPGRWGLSGALLLALLGCNRMSRRRATDRG